MNSLKIQRADGSSRTIGSISDCTHKYNADQTATITVLVEVQDYQDEREVTLRTGDVAYLMSDTGNTLTAYYPAPTRGGV